MKHTTPWRTAFAAATFVMSAASASAATLEGFEVPALPANTHQYLPSGSGWTFAGTTGAGLQRNGSPFNAPAAPQGVQTAFLKSNDGSVSRSVALAPGVYRVSFQAARRASSTVINPVQVWLNGAAVGGTLSPTSSSFTRLTSATVTVPSTGSYTLKLSTTKAGDYTTLVDNVTIDLVNPFDTLYGAQFVLKPLASEVPPVVAKPSVKAGSLSVASYIDPVYDTRVYKATAASDLPGAAFVRHEYSRRQAFNANNTRYLAQSSNGTWLLYNADTFTVIRTLTDMAGDCEPIWHPTDPTKLWFTGRNGGLVWWEKNVETNTRTVIGDFSTRIPTLWPGATAVWMGAEGTSSADGRYFAFMATHYDEPTATKQIKGIFTWDRQTDQIIGTLGAAQFGNVYPDHISMSPSGKYAVPSWAYTPTLGTRAYTRDFASFIQLNDQSEHSDLAIGPEGQDYYVVAKEAAEHIKVVNMDNGASFNLMRLYPRSGSAYAAHISAQAFDRPGWVLVSTYGDSANYGAVRPDGTLEPMYRKLMMVELKPGGKQYAVAHTRAAAGYQYHSADEGTLYFGEHQASISRDASRVIFATNFNDQGPPDSYVIGLPSWVPVGTPGSSSEPPAGSGPLVLTLGTVTRNGYSGSYSVTSSVPALCRQGTTSGHPYGALYDDLSTSANGLTHTKTTSFGTSSGAQTVYVQCKANATAEEKSLTVTFP